MKEINNINDLLIVPTHNKIVYNKQLCTEVENYSARSFYDSSCSIVIYKCNENDYVAQHKTNQTVYKSIPFFMASNQQLIQTNIVSRVLLHQPSYDDCNCQTDRFTCEEPFSISTCIYSISNGLTPMYYVRFRIKFQNNDTVYYEHSEYIEGDKKSQFYESMNQFIQLRQKIIYQQCSVV